MRIGDREIGVNHPPYVIAEIGVNHDGEVERALELTDAAADAGADAVKLQFFETDRLMSKAAKLAAYQKDAGETDPIEMLRRLELTIDEMALVVDRAHERGIHAIVTVFSTELVEVAETLAWDAYKTASPDIVNWPLLEALMATGKPMIVSTGASDMLDIQETYHNLLEPISNRTAMLQCVSCYPTSREDASIAGMHRLDSEILWYDGALGYSDHTSAIDTGALAVRIGARILEKHFTDDRTRKGPDHSASLEPESFREYVRNAKQTKNECASAPETVEDLVDPPSEILESDPAYGPLEKTVLDCEIDVRRVSRQSLVLVVDAEQGQTITREMLTTKRPGTGLWGKDIDKVVGQRAMRAIQADTPLTEDDVPVEGLNCDSTLFQSHTERKNKSCLKKSKKSWWSRVRGRSLGS